MADMERPIQFGLTALPHMRFRLRTLLIMITLVAIALTGLRWIKYYSDPFAGRSFDREVWHQFHSNDDPDNPRASMVESLQRSYLHPGLTRQQVVQLLGEPDLDESLNMSEYNLGMWSGFRMDYDGLQVYFDKQGRLTCVQCVQH
jgi:SmpA / OmlA family